MQGKNFFFAPVVKAYIGLQETRLLAAILAKNAVAKFWPAGGTHPLLIPVVAGEKARCRERVMDCLRSEPLERIATQVCIARYTWA